MIGIIYATGFKLMHLLGLAMERLLRKLSLKTEGDDFERF
jgi:hypothetical protein